MAIDLGRHLTRAAYRHLTVTLGLNLPAWTQYLLWLKMLITTGTLGGLMVTLVPPTAELLVTGALISMGLTIVVVSIEAMNPSSFLARALSVATYTIYALPGFWVGVILLWEFGAANTWFPATGPSVVTPGFGAWADHMVLPMATLVLVTVGGWTRYLSADLDEVMSQDFIRTARAKGVSRLRLVIRHGIRNSLLPLITLVGMSFPSMLNLVVVIEVIYVTPGLGSSLLDALNGLQFPMAVDLTIILAMFAVVGSFLADIVYTVVDPRVQYD